jgi:hypothetical protein
MSGFLGSGTVAAANVLAAGSASEVQINSGGALGAASNVKAGTGYIGVGLTPHSTIGDVRFGYGASSVHLAVRNSTDSANHQLIWQAFGEYYFGSDSSGIRILSPSRVLFQVNGNSAYLELASSGNVSLFAAGSYGGGVGVLGIINRTTAPTSNPTGGAILYTEAGATKVRGSGGTTTTIAPA